MSWLEHAARAAAGALRPVDAYYEPYNLLEAKAEWGRAVLAARHLAARDLSEMPLVYPACRMHEEGQAGGSQTDAESPEHDAPWMVWDQAERGGGLGSSLGGGRGGAEGGEDALAMVLAMIQGVGNRS